MAKADLCKYPHIFRLLCVSTLTSFVYFPCVTCYLRVCYLHVLTAALPLISFKPPDQCSGQERNATEFCEYCEFSYVCRIELYRTLYQLQLRIQIDHASAKLLNYHPCYPRRMYYSIQKKLSTKILVREYSYLHNAVSAFRIT